MAKSWTIIRHRNSKTGRFVKEGYAKKHPDTTEKEKIRVRRTK